MRRLGALVLLGSLVSCGGSSAPLSVTWDESEGHPGCTYDAASGAVVAHVRVTGSSGRPTVSVTVTAYADENTSKPVGSTTRDVPVTGGDRSLDLTIQVTKAPHVGEDDVAACSLESD